MNAQIELIPGTNRDTSLSQWFTPPDLAAKVVEWARVTRGQYEVRGEGMMAEGSYRPMRVLEPSAGNGALVRPLVAAGAEVVCIELDERYYDELRGPDHATWIDNFLEFELGSWPMFDLCVMNPPYECGMDVAFILHALKFAPRVVGIFTDRIMFGIERKEGLWSKVRPTRIAFCSRRPWKGAQTDYVALELVSMRYPELHNGGPHPTTVEFW